MLDSDRSRIGRQSFSRTYIGELQHGTPSKEGMPKAETLFDVALANMPHGLCMFDDAPRLILCNAAYSKLYDLPARLTRRGTPLEEILRFRLRRGNGPVDRSTYSNVVEDARRAGGCAAGRVLLCDGRTIQITHNPMANGGYVATHEDVTEWVRAEAEVRHFATHDVLTGLPNRSLFADKLAETLRNPDSARRVAIHCFDLDRFKAVNDVHGHPVGDKLLQSVAARVAAITGPNDLPARLGGDEFVILQTEVESAEHARRMSSQLIAEIGRPYVFDNQTLTIGVSVGSALCLEGALTGDALLQQADLALYRAKLDGRNTGRIYEAGMDSQMRDRRRLEADLREAIAAQALDLRYQPLVESRTGRVGGFEALARWDHPIRGRVAPSDFIPVAEDAGFITDVSAWVLGRACRDAAAWPDDVRVAVNLSPLDFKDGGIVKTVHSALRVSGLAPSRLEIEITESVLLVDGDATLSRVHALRRLGVRISLDDFGTGYASLSYLRRFPFDKIKIDSSFVRDMKDRAECAAIVQAMTALGHALRMIVTVEGVENLDQLELVRDYGCDEVQGYFFSAAVPLAEAVDMLRSRSCLTSVADFHAAGP